MSGLLIRVDPAECVLRSVGGEPNGIVCLGAPDGAPAWLIDAAFEPPGYQLRTDVVLSRPSRSGVGEASTVVTPHALAAACEGVVEAQALMRFAAASISHAVAEAGLHFEYVASHVLLAIVTRDALVEAGFLRQGRS